MAPGVFRTGQAGPSLPLPSGRLLRVPLCCNPSAAVRPTNLCFLLRLPLYRSSMPSRQGVSGTSRDWRSPRCRTYSGRRALPFRTSPRPWPPFLQGTRPAQMRRHGCVPSRLEGRRCSRHCRAMTPVDSASSPRHSVSQPACHIARESPGLLLPWR